MRSRYIHTKMLLVISSIFFCLCLSAQSSPIYGTAGTDTIDQALISRMQFISPDFSFNSSMEAFTLLLVKHYSLVKAKSDAMRASGASSDPAVQATLRAIRQQAEDKYLASLYDKKQSDSVYTVTDAEVTKYYNDHLGLFTGPDVYSYWLAYVSDTMAHPISAVKKQLKAYAEQHKEEFRTGDKGDLYFVFEKDRVIGKDDYYFTFLSRLKDGEYALLPNGGKNVVMMMRYHLAAGTPAPLSQVRDQCRAALVNAKRMQATEDFADSAIAKYPIHLKPEAFQKPVVK